MKSHLNPEQQTSPSSGNLKEEHFSRQTSKNAVKITNPNIKNCQGHKIARQYVANADNQND